MGNGAWTGVWRPSGSEGFNLGHGRARPVTEALVLGAFQKGLAVLEVNLPPACIYAATLSLPCRGESASRIVISTSCPSLVNSRRGRSTE